VYVRHLSMRDFRSWRSLEVDLAAETTIFVGRNGFGKTNILEALYYLTNLRSHRVSTDAPLVHHGAEAAVIAATVEHNGRELTAELTVNASGANKARINQSPARRPRELIGILRSVMFAPEDLLLVRGDPSDRRRFVDEIVAQQGPLQVAARADYDKVLRQRTALLKTAGAAMRRGGSEAASVISTLDVWDAQLADLGARITAARIDVLAALRPHVVAAYTAIAPHSRPADLRYRPAAGPHLLPGPGSPAVVADIREHLLAGLAELRGKEIERGVCLVGPHRDDIDVILGEQVAKGFASHGESWSLALSLRLGSVELLRADGIEPVIMLDDVFAELDTARRRQLVEFTASAHQLLITAAVAEDIPDGLGGRTLDIDIVTDDAGRSSRLITGDDRCDGQQQRDG
jgi:DNA replication and repair protein RecF